MPTSIRKPARAQDDGAVSGAAFPIEIAEVSDDQFNEITEVLRDVYGDRFRPAGLQPPVQERPLFRARRLAAHRPPPARGDVPAARGNRRCATDDQTRSGTFANTVVGLNTFYLSGTDVELLLGPALFRLDRQFLDRVPLFALRSAGPAGSVRRRRGAGRQPDPAHPRRRADNPSDRDDGASRSARASRARPTTSRPQLDQWRVVAQLRRSALTALEVRRRAQPRGPVQPVRPERHRHAGLPQPRRPARPACFRPAPATTTTSTAAIVVTGAVEGALRQLPRPATSTMPARPSSATIYSVVRAGRLEVSPTGLPATLGVRVDVVQAATRRLNRTPSTATASPTRPASATSRRSG